MGWEPLHEAAVGGHKATVETLIQYAANINALDQYLERTPLHMAAVNGKQNNVEVLFNAGADVTITDIEGYSPLDVAVKHKHWPIVEFLAQQNVNLVTPCTFRLAVLEQQEILIKLFVSLGADPLRVDDLGRNSMDWASLHPQTLDMMKLLCNCEYQPTDKTITNRILMELIVDYAETEAAEMEKPEADVQDGSLFQIGVILLYLDDLIEASTVFAL